MRASVRADSITRIIALEVSGVPDVDVTENWHNRPRVMRPDHVTVRVVDGEVKELKASGPILRKDGKPGGQRGDASWWPTQVMFRERTVGNAPGWVRRLWSEAPTGVTFWDDPGQPGEGPPAEGIEMTERTKHLGRQTGESSDKYLSPQHPYTGDGQTTRQTHDPVTVTERTADGSTTR